MQYCRASQNMEKYCHCESSACFYILCIGIAHFIHYLMMRSRADLPAIVHKIEKKRP